MRVGDPDGYGRYGILDVEGGRLVCHECGHTYLHLATHVHGAHGLTGEEYRVRHGLPLTIRLVASAVRERMSMSWEQHRDAHVAALAAHRDPDRARGRVRSQSEWSPATRVARARMLADRRGRLLTEDEMRMLGDEVPMQQWCDRVRALLAADPAVTGASIGRSFDRSPDWVGQRLRRYPPGP